METRIKKLEEALTYIRDIGKNVDPSKYIKNDIIYNMYMLQSIISDFTARAGSALKED